MLHLNFPNRADALSSRDSAREAECVSALPKQDPQGLQDRIHCKYPTGLPTQHTLQHKTTQDMQECSCTRLGDVGLAAGGVIRGVLLVHNGGIWVDDLLDHLGQLQHGELRGVANVEGARVGAIHHPHHACSAEESYSYTSSGAGKFGAQV